MPYSLLIVIVFQPHRRGHDQRQSLECRKRERSGEYQARSGGFYRFAIVPLEGAKLRTECDCGAG